jgi:hypothetical protein
MTDGGIVMRAGISGVGSEELPTEQPPKWVTLSFLPALSTMQKNGGLSTQSINSNQRRGHLNERFLWIGKELKIQTLILRPPPVNEARTRV